MAVKTHAVLTAVCFSAEYANMDSAVQGSAPPSPAPALAWAKSKQLPDNCVSRFVYPPDRAWRSDQQVECGDLILARLDAGVWAVTSRSRSTNPK